MFENLRDWAVKQQILASDLQGFKDRHDAVFPLSFSGNVKVQGGMLHGMHVHVPPVQFVVPALPRLHITGNLSGAGKYLARIVKPPTGTLLSSADLSGTDLGDDGDTDVAAYNQQELNTTSGTHWLTHADNANQKYFEAVAVLGTDDEGRTVYAFNALWAKTC